MYIMYQQIWPDIYCITDIYTHYICMYVCAYINCQMSVAGRPAAGSRQEERVIVICAQRGVFQFQCCVYAVYAPKTLPGKAGNEAKTLTCAGKSNAPRGRGRVRGRRKGAERKRDRKGGCVFLCATQLVAIF